jgi:hypothetical protein
MHSARSQTQTSSLSSSGQQWKDIMIEDGLPGKIFSDALP